MDKLILSCKTCSVNLVRTEFSKIRIKCSGVSDQGDRLKCAVTQDDANTFCIAIKRSADSAFGKVFLTKNDPNVIGNPDQSDTGPFSTEMKRKKCENEVQSENQSEGIRSEYKVIVLHCNSFSCIILFRYEAAP